MNIDEIHKFEYWLEESFAKILAPTGVKIFDTASRPLTAITPRVEVKAIVGSYIEHRKLFAAQAKIGNTTQNLDAFDAYEGEILIMAVTNRTDDGFLGDHRRLLGIIRGRMLKWNVLQNWSGTIILPADVRPTGTFDTQHEEENCDVTGLSHSIVFGINTQGVWPDTLS